MASNSYPDAPAGGLATQKRAKLPILNLEPTERCCCCAPFCWDLRTGVMVIAVLMVVGGVFPFFIGGIAAMAQKHAGVGVIYFAVAALEITVGVIGILGTSEQGVKEYRPATLSKAKLFARIWLTYACIKLVLAIIFVIVIFAFAPLAGVFSLTWWLLAIFVTFYYAYVVWSYNIKLHEESQGIFHGMPVRNACTGAVALHQMQQLSPAYAVQQPSTGHNNPATEYEYAPLKNATQEPSAVPYAKQ